MNEMVGEKRSVLQQFWTTWALEMTWR